MFPPDFERTINSIPGWCLKIHLVAHLLIIPKREKDHLFIIYSSLSTAQNQLSTLQPSSKNIFVSRASGLWSLEHGVHGPHLQTVQWPSHPGENRSEEKNGNPRDLRRCFFFLTLAGVAIYIYIHPSLPNTLWVGVWIPKQLLRRHLGVPNTYSQGIWRILED